MNEAEVKQSSPETVFPEEEINNINNNPQDNSHKKSCLVQIIKSPQFYIILVLIILIVLFL